MKLSKDILKKVKQIEIQTRRLMCGTLMGDHRSAQKGTGLDFDQIREYQQGDDVRFIDWNASARSDKLLVKQYIEERNRTIMLLIDVSGSQLYGSQKVIKSEVVAQVASVLALVVDYGKDYSGAILFTDEVIKVIPPQRGRKHVHYIMEQVFSTKSSGTTSLKKALEKLLLVQKQPAIVCIISDFLTRGYEQALKVAARQHEVIAVRCTDPRERSLPVCGLLPVKDPETGTMGVISTDNKEINKVLDTYYAQHDRELQRLGIDALDIQTNRPFIGDIIRFFRRRMRY